MPELSSDLNFSNFRLNHICLIIHYNHHHRHFTNVLAYFLQYCFMTSHESGWFADSSHYDLCIYRVVEEKCFIEHQKTSTTDGWTDGRLANVMCNVWYHNIVEEHREQNRLSSCWLLLLLLLFFFVSSFEYYIYRILYFSNWQQNVSHKQQFRWCLPFRLPVLFTATKVLFALNDAAVWNWCW